MDVLSIEEQDDGSAIVTLNMTEKENDMLVEYAVLNLLKEHIERIDNEQGTDKDGELSLKESLKPKDF